MILKRSIGNLMASINHQLYDIIFATGSSGMNNVMTDLKGILEKIKTKDFRNVFEVLAGSQQQLTFFD